jgi:hypothetical protein
MMDDLVRVEVGWVCFDVLFFISEFHFLLLTWCSTCDVGLCVGDCFRKLHAGQEE